MNIALPYVSIKPNYFTTYTRRDQTGDHFQPPKPTLPPPIDRRHHGIISKKANGRVRTAIDWLIHLSENKKSPTHLKTGEFAFKLNFVTLTLSSIQRHTDNEIKSKLLNQFLTELRQKHKCKNYMWRAETQRNGNLHFHVVTDVFIPWRELRTDWNRIQEKLGYVSEFTRRTGKADPNSTDVHAIKHVKNLSGYLSKYVGKNTKGYTVMTTRAFNKPFKPESWLTYKHTKLDLKAQFYRQVHGKLWGLSQTLSRLKSGAQEVCGVLEQEIEWLKTKDPRKVKFVDHACCYFYSVADLAKYKCTELVKLFHGYKKSVLDPVVKTIEVALDPIVLSLPPPVYRQSVFGFGIPT